MAVSTEVSCDCNDWSNYPKINSVMLTKIVDLVLSRFKNIYSVEKLDISILLTDDERMKNLNFEFRGKNKATDVLSFPDIEINWRELPNYKPEESHLYLGDIAFGYQTVAKQSIEMSSDFEDYFKHLLIHAVLHLLGYDHVDDDDAEAMEAMEKEALLELGIKMSY
ncbi:MAG: rRNA maturation RNase YbeY [Rickettsiales bacterium]|nr:rRNA maturation RNase YbeY [Rickettsiales bacterium]